MNLIDHVEQRNGWWWPRSDVRCWEYMLSHPDVPTLVAAHVEKNNRKVIIQAGGNCGFYPKQYADLFETVYTFEPDWLNFYCLNLNVPNSNVIKNQSCLGNEHKLVSLNVKEVNRGKNYINGNGIYPVFKIDDLNLENCSAIQLDIEGFEYYALLGAVNTINKFKPIIVLEMWDKLDGRYETNINQKTISFLNSIGYIQLETIYESDKVFKFKV
jgi:FkbM family methyltransferase